MLEINLDKETLENTLATLSKTSFDDVCRVLLEDYFQLDVVNVDRQGDGGADWIVIPEDGGRRTFVAQATVQDSKWKDKCLRDAEKAISNYGCGRYIFLTSRRHYSTSFLDVENDIATKYSVPATALGAVEIADILISKNLAERAFAAAGMKSTTDSQRPSYREQQFLSALSLSNAATDLREQVYDDAIIYVLSDNTELERSALKGHVVEVLQCGEHRELRINARIDSLMTRGIILKPTGESFLSLSAKARKSIDLARQSYNSNFEDLKSVVSSILSRYDCALENDSDISDIATFASRAMIKQTLSQTEQSGLDLNINVLNRQIGEPESDLANVFTKNNVNADLSREISIQIAEATRSHPLVIRLSHELLHFAIEGINSAYNIRGLGVASWNDTCPLIDASVAIPFICSKLTKPSEGRFSRGAIASIDRLQKVGAKIHIPRDYLNEAAVHLLHAIDYCRSFDDNFADVLISSPNGYVSHYYTLKKSDSSTVPNRLIDFITTISPSIKTASPDHIVRQIMNDLESRFRSYSIEKIYLEDVDEAAWEDISTAYRANIGFSQPRENILVDHDVRTISWMSQRAHRGEHGTLCVTWDGSFIKTMRDRHESGWAVTPHQIADLITVGERLQQRSLLGVVHELAAVQTKDSDFVGALLDNVIKYTRDGVLDWQVVEELSQIRSQLHEHSQRYGPPDNQYLEKVEKDFWERHGIDPRKEHDATHITREQINDALNSQAPR